jgi:diguanylate cyclase (GGDEF)-like protein
MFLDLDNFKPLNDQYGHKVGDMLLIEAADRLKKCIREMDTVARFGGDEFVVIISELAADKAGSINQATAVAEKIRLAISEPYRLRVILDEKPESTVEHHCTVTIGAALFIDQENGQDDILKWADTAMYEAKAAGRNRVQFFDANN